MDDDTDAKMILTAPPPENWKRPPGRPRITWLNIVQCDERVQPHTERINRSGSELPSVEADVYVWRYALLVVQARKEEEKESYMDKLQSLLLSWRYSLAVLQIQ